LRVLPALTHFSVLVRLTENYLYEYFVEKKDSAPFPLRCSLSLMATEIKTQTMFAKLAEEQRAIRDLCTDLKKSLDRLSLKQAAAPALAI
jgi:hypothetical protein